MGAMAYTDAVQAKLYPGAHGQHFWWQPPAAAAGIAAIDTYQKDHLIERSAAMGEVLLGRLRGGRRARGARGAWAGTMVGIELRQKPGPILKTLMEEHGVIPLPAERMSCARSRC